ncbi:uncharacterized protein LOC143291993 [Babylonia areolata]|uniref:uncharacterized protein LOC143291993 n=1 Tax=Babylonia areolata TaxID=304850 RepID=UPI003FD49218
MPHDLRMVGAMMVCLLVAVSQQSATDGPDTQHQSPVQQTSNRHRRTVGGDPFQQLVDALQSEDMSNHEMYMHYTPTTPAPHNINCYVEVPTTLRKGGRCIQLGRFRGRGRGSRNRPWACQAGIHLAFSPDCAQPRRRSRRLGRG